MSEKINDTKKKEKKERSKFMKWVIKKWYFLMYGLYWIIFIPLMLTVFIIVVFLDGLSWVLLQTSFFDEFFDNEVVAYNPIITGTYEGTELWGDTKVTDDEIV